MSRSGRSLIVQWSRGLIVRFSHSLIVETMRPPDYPTTQPKGQAALEFLLVLLILVPLLFGGIELARGVGIRHALDSGVGVAARALSLDPTQWSWAVSTIQQAVSNNPLGGGAVSAATVKVYNAGGIAIGSSGLAALPFGAAFRLEASCTYTPEIILVGGQMVSIRVSHWGIVERFP